MRVGLLLGQAKSSGVADEEMTCSVKMLFKATNAPDAASTRALCA